jgi:hypothetical protein
MKCTLPLYLLLGTTLVSSSIQADDLLAHFRLDGDAKDSLGRSREIELKNARFSDHSLFLNGIYEHDGSRQGYRAVAHINGLSYSNYTLSLGFLPLDFKPSKPLNMVERWADTLTRGHYARWTGRQRGKCENILTGGPSYRWIGFDCSNGVLELTLNNQSFRHSFKEAVVETRRWHNLICSFDLKRRTILTYLDGKSLEKIQLPDDFRLEIIGSPDEPTDRSFTFINYSNGSTFFGHAANLKVFGSALNGPEIAKLYLESTAEHPSSIPRNGRLLILNGILGGLFVIVVSIVAWSRRRRVAEISVKSD